MTSELKCRDLTARDRDNIGMYQCAECDWWHALAGYCACNAMQTSMDRPSCQMFRLRQTPKVR